MIFEDESYIWVTRDEDFEIGQEFFKKGRRERIGMVIDMEKNSNDAYFYKWGNYLSAKTDSASMDDGKSFSTGSYIVSGSGFQCV